MSQTVANSVVSFLPSSADLDIDKKWFIPSWYALYTRSRHEKFLAEELRKKNIETFLPLRKISRQWSDRKTTIEEPLFGGYLFVHIPLINQSSVLNVKGAVHLIGSKNAPVEVPEKDISAIKAFIENEIRIDPFPYLKIGQLVRVHSGPFKGVEGFIVRKDKRCRLVISFDLIMNSVSIEIDEACVEPI
jgi:transcriptional antiterminator NusG